MTFYMETGECDCDRHEAHWLGDCLYYSDGA